MSMSRLQCVFLTVLMGVLAGCGSGPAAESAERCYGGGIYDYDGSRGQATPGAAVRAMADQKEVLIEKELATIAPTEERDRRLAQDRAAVRGLRALQAAADEADGVGTLEAKAEEGSVVATADIVAAPAGGFFISSLNAEADCQPVTSPREGT